MFVTSLLITARAAIVLLTRCTANEASKQTDHLPFKTDQRSDRILGTRVLSCSQSSVQAIGIGIYHQHRQLQQFFCVPLTKKQISGVRHS
jgi:hypothetical protein